MDPCQRLCQLIGYRLPVAVKGQQSLVHGGIVPSARRGHGIDTHVCQTRREVGRGKAAGAVADQALVGGGQPDVALGVQSGAVHRVGTRARVRIPLRTVGGDPRKALLARDQYISLSGNVDPVVVGRVRHLVGLHREGRAVQPLTAARDLRQCRAVGAQIDVVRAVRGQAAYHAAVFEEQLRVQHGQHTVVLHDRALSRAHGAPQAAIAVDPQRISGFARYVRVAVGHQKSAADPAHAGGRGNVNGAVASLREIAYAQIAVLFRTGHGGKDAVFVDEHPGVAMAPLVLKLWNSEPSKRRRPP